MKVSSKTLQEVINTKAYYIARKALWFTPKADIGKIREVLGEAKAMNLVRLKSGRWSRNKKNTVSFFGRGGATSTKTGRAPYLALIVQKRRGRAGHPSPWKGLSRAAGAAAMLQVMRQVFGARLRSVAFLKAGWLPAIRELAPYAEKSAGLPPMDGKQVGRPKGGARAAQPGFNPVAQVLNNASASRDTRAALMRYGAPALQKAFDDEAFDMTTYIKRKMQPDAAAFNAKQK